MEGRALFDPKALIWESFRIPGISEPECRSIFLDWALSLEAMPPREAIIALQARHSAEPSDHPMKAVLAEGLSAQPTTGRRGGRRARVGDGDPA